MRPVIIVSLLLTLLGGCAKYFTPQACRELTSKDGHTYRFCESANSITVERLQAGTEAGAPPPHRLLDDPEALEILRRDAFGSAETPK